MTEILYSISCPVSFLSLLDYFYQYVNVLLFFLFLKFFSSPSIDFSLFLLSFLATGDTGLHCL